VSADLTPLSAGEIEHLREPAKRLLASCATNDAFGRSRAADDAIARLSILSAPQLLWLLAAAESVAAKDAEIAGLQVENDRLRAALIDQLQRDTLVSELVLNGGGMTTHLEGGACQLFADAFAQQIIGSGAENYVEATFGSRLLPPGESLVVTLQRRSGQTPHQLRRAAESERDALRQRAEKAEADAALLRSAIEQHTSPAWECNSDHPALHAALVATQPKESPDAR